MLDFSKLDFIRRGALGRLVGSRSTARREGPSAATRVVCVASGKGGTGKTILSTNLASLRARSGERVLLIDFDAGLANAHLLLGLAPRYDLGHIIDGSVDPFDTLVEGPEGLMLLSGGVGRHALANPTRKELDRLFRGLQELENEFDLIVVDHGAGMTYGTVAHLAATSTLMLVCSHEVTGLSDAYAIYKRALMVNPHVRVGLLVNRAPDAAAADAAWERFRSASHRFLGAQPEWIGWVPADESVQRSVETRRPVTLAEPESPAGSSLIRISQWGPIDMARTSTAFYERARRALR